MQKCNNRGHRLDKGQVWLNYELTLADGTVIAITERPEYIAKEDGQNGFERHLQNGECTC